MQIRRLGFAGLEVTSRGSSIVIDLLEDLGAMTALFGEPRDALPGPEGRGAVAGGLITHLHRDHADAQALATALAPRAPVLRPAAMPGAAAETIGTALAEQELVAYGLDQHDVVEWRTTEIGPFSVTPVPAVDGFGDPQVSWVVADQERRIVHCGDTLFHGSWWLIRDRLGPFDAAFVPVNGAMADLPHRQPASVLPASMDPEQAAAAAAILGARVAVPIHYRTLHAPPIYSEVPDPANAFLAAAARLGVTATFVAPGDDVPLPDVA